MNQLHDSIQAIIAEECFLKREEVTDNALFSTLGVDSLAQIQIWMRIGQEFEVEIPEPDNDFWSHNGVTCLQDVLQVVNRMRELPAATPVLQRRLTA